MPIGCLRRCLRYAQQRSLGVWPDPKSWSTFLRESTVGACVGQPTELVAGRRSVSGVEFDGQGCWAGDSGDLLPGCGSAAVWVGHAARDDGQGFGEFDSGEVRAEAVVGAAAEGEHG